MSNSLTDTPEFIDGFVKYCFDKGFSEKQASELLRVAVLNELAESNDPSFHEGLRIGSQPKYEKMATVKKEAFFKKLLGIHPPFPAPPRFPGPHLPPPPTLPKTHYNLNLPIGLSHALARGAGTAALGGVGGAMFGDPDNGIVANSLGGAALGAGLRTAMGPMFRGNNFRKFLSGMNPFESAGAGTSRGTIGVNLLRPIETMGKALTAKGMPTALATGAGYGALGGAAWQLGSQSANSGVTDTSQFLPYYMQNGGSGIPGPGSTAGTAGLFSMPSSLRDYYSSGSGSPMGTAGVSSDLNPIAKLRAAQAEQSGIDSKINVLNQKLQTMDPNLPMSALERLQIQKELTKLQVARNQSQGSLEELLNTIQSDRGIARGKADTAANAASRQIERIQRELEGNTEDYNAGKGSFFSDLYNKMNPFNWGHGGIENRLQNNARKLMEQKRILQQANKAQAALG